MDQTKYAVIDNRSHQQAMADSLIKESGSEEAILICQENGWNGVLNCLLNRRTVAKNMKIN